MVNSFSVNLKNNPYGNIERIGESPNNRALYSVTDSEGKYAGKFSIPMEDVDTFEASYKEILKSAPKIEAYVAANSSEESINKRRKITQGIIGASGLVGVGIPLLILRKSTSVTKKILGAVAGTIAGLAVGFVGSLGVTTPPGSLEFAKASRELSKLDIQQVPDENESNGTL